MNQMRFHHCYILNSGVAKFSPANLHIATFNKFDEHQNTKKTVKFSNKFPMEGQTSPAVGDTILFRGCNIKTNEYPCFSNFYKSPITDPDDSTIKYTCVEQYFQYKKAMYALDTNAAESILATSNPLRQNQLGRKAKFGTTPGHTLQEWDDRESYAVMKEEGVRLKFTQNEFLGKVLISTGNRVIGEANPRDKRWGTGLDKNHPDAQHPSRWPGRNHLGKILMEVHNP
jgi:ribA/ribD-fused uncharacterized protein